MAQRNSTKVSHDVDDHPNIFRDDHLRQILNDINDEIVDNGYSEPVRDVNGLLTSLTVWESPSKLIKKLVTTITRSNSPFVSSVVNDYYDTDGIAIISTVTDTIVRDGNKRIVSIDTVTTRP